MSEHESTNHTEYSYEKRVETSDKIKKILFIIAAVIVLASPLLIAVITKVYLIIMLYALVFAVGIPFAKFMMRYTQKEFNYIVDRSTFQMQVMYGKSKPKTVFETDAKDLEFAVAATEENKAAHPEKDYDKVYKCWVFEGSPDVYMMAFTDSKGKKCLGYFEGTKKALKIMNYYNKKVEVNSSLTH